MALQQHWKPMMERGCLDWGLWIWALHLSLGPILVMYALRFLARKTQFLLDEICVFFFFFEIDSHRNSPGSNEKKTLSSLTLLLKNITGSVFNSSFLVMQEMSSYDCVYSGGAWGTFSIIMQCLPEHIPRRADWQRLGKQLSYDQSQPRIRMKPSTQKY